MGETYVQDFGPTGTLATKILEFWTYWNPCVKDFRILDLLEPLRQRFQSFGPTGTLASKISEFWAPRLMPRDIRSS